MDSFRWNTGILKLGSTSAGDLHAKCDLQQYRSTKTYDPHAKYDQKKCSTLVLIITKKKRRINEIMK